MDDEDDEDPRQSEEVKCDIKLEPAPAEEDHQQDQDMRDDSVEIQPKKKPMRPALSSKKQPPPKQQTKPQKKRDAMEDYGQEDGQNEQEEEEEDQEALRERKQRFYDEVDNEEFF